jgi:hypothetical protein
MKHNNQAVLKYQNKTPSVGRLINSGILYYIIESIVHDFSIAL